MKKLITLLICLTLAVSLFSGCGEKEETEKETKSETVDTKSDEKDSNESKDEGKTSEEADVQEEIVYDLLIVQNVLVEDYATNAFVKYFEEQTGVKFNFQTVSGEDAEEKINLLLASGEYPDAFITWDFNKATLAQYGELGMIIDLKDLIEDNAPILTGVFEEHSWVKAGVISPDGAIYSMPQAEENYQTTMHHRMYVYDPWLEQLDIAVPETTDEFYDMLKAFKTQDPNGNGKADEIPLSAANGWGSSIVPFLMNSFQYHDGNTLLDPMDGTLEFAAVKDGWREGLRYLNKLYEEGLINEDAFTQPWGTLQELGENPEPILGAGTAGWMNEIAVNYGDSGRYMEYNTIPPVAGPDGTRYTTLETPMVRNMLVITDKAEQPERLVKAMDMCYDAEVVKLLYYGLEGKGWRPAEAGEEGPLGDAADFTILEGKGVDVQNDAVFNLWPSFRSAGFFNSITFNGDPTDHEGRLLKSAVSYAPYATKEAIGPLFFTLEEAERLQDETDGMMDSVNEYIAGFVTGVYDVDSDWDAYVQLIEDLGRASYIEIHQAAYDRARQ